MNWSKCRKKPVVVEYREAIPGETIQTREGSLVAQPGDYIIRGIQGEIYLISRAIFEKTYDRIGSDDSGQCISDVELHAFVGRAIQLGADPAQRDKIRELVLAIGHRFKGESS